jgi:DNA polymerase I-like protein with 3'-5' exonuclease and polymerase domains
VCKEKDGTFHAQFNQVVAATHRLTSSGIPLAFLMFDGAEKSVQFQNMPRVFKRCFKAPPGYKIAEVDAMQLEFRVAAFVGDDAQARADIADPDFDAHCRTASVIYDLDYGEFLAAYRNGDSLRKAQRQDAKADTFKPLYGGTRGTPGQEAYYKSFAERYGSLADTQDNWLSDVQRDGTLRTDWGMVFSWETYTKPDGMVMDKRTHKPARPQVCNYPVQNLATAEIVPIAIVALYKRCKAEGLDVKFVNTIHDSVIVYIKDCAHTQNAFQDACSWAFTTAVYEHLELFYNIEFDVPLGMEMVTGDYWNEGTEYVYDDVRKK